MAAALKNKFLAVKNGLQNQVMGKMIAKTVGKTAIEFVNIKSNGKSQ